MIRNLLTVACVLKSGGEFTADHVRDLKKAVEVHMDFPHRFVCLSDIPLVGVEAIPIVHDWPRWWPKIELFRPGLFPGRVIYFDLDTWITGQLNDIAKLGVPFAMLSDFYQPRIPASGMMMWVPCPQTYAIYDHFKVDPRTAMRVHEGEGDGGYIRSLYTEVQVPRIQDLLPGQVVSWKVHCAEDGIPPEASVVCFHGLPRPWEVEEFKP